MLRFPVLIVIVASLATIYACNRELSCNECILKGCKYYGTGNGNFCSGESQTGYTFKVKSSSRCPQDHDERKSRDVTQLTNTPPTDVRMERPPQDDGIKNEPTTTTTTPKTSNTTIALNPSNTKNITNPSIAKNTPRPSHTRTTSKPSNATKYEFVQNNDDDDEAAETTIVPAPQKFVAPPHPVYLPPSVNTALNNISSTVPTANSTLDPHQNNTAITTQALESYPSMGRTLKGAKNIVEDRMAKLEKEHWIHAKCEEFVAMKKMSRTFYGKERRFNFAKQMKNCLRFMPATW